MVRQAPRFLATALCLALLGVGLAGGPAAGQNAELRGYRGPDLTAADLGKGSTVLVVWASWSPHCRDIAERINRLQSRWGGEARVVAVNFQEDRDDVERFLQGSSLRVPVFLDVEGSFGKKHGITWLPGLVVYRDGEVVHAGRLPEDPDRLLRELLP